MTQLSFDPFLKQNLSVDQSQVGKKRTSLSHGNNLSEHGSGKAVKFQLVRINVIYEVITIMVKRQSSFSFDRLPLMQ